MNEAPVEFKHPITGVVHKATETGWSPEPLSFPSFYKDNRWKTCVIQIPEGDEEFEKFDASMKKIAEGLSQITGLRIEWRSTTDSDHATWGRFGWFIVEKR